MLERVRRWFGYKLHLLIDSSFEIPIPYRVETMDTSPF